MRNYPRNSPEAAGRLLALTMMVDGHVCRREVDLVRQQGLEAALGLPPEGLGRVLQDLCEDLLQSAAAQGELNCSIDDALLASLLAEVDAPALRRQLVRALEDLAAADGHLADAEARVLGAMYTHWPEARGLPEAA